MPPKRKRSSLRGKRTQEQITGEKQFNSMSRTMTQTITRPVEVKKQFVTDSYGKPVRVLPQGQIQMQKTIKTKQ